MTDNDRPRAREARIYSLKVVVEVVAEAYSTLAFSILAC